MKIFPKPTTWGTDNTLILDAREPLVYKFRFSDWNTLRLGMFFSFCPVNSDNSGLLKSPYRTPAEEYVVGLSTIEDYLFFGLKDYSTNFPGRNGSRYVGMNCLPVVTNTFKLTDEDASPNHYKQFQEINFGSINHNGIKDVSAAWAGGSDNEHRASMYHTYLRDVGNTSLYCTFFRTQFSVVDKGLSTQKIAINFDYSDGFNSSPAGNLVADRDQCITDTTETNFYRLLNKTNSTLVKTANWNISGVPYALPDAIFVYLPFSDVRLRIHSLGVAKVN